MVHLKGKNYCCLSMI